MSIWFTAYAAYGIPLPDEYTDKEAVGELIRGIADVGTLDAGPYDHHRLYLVTECVEADIRDKAEPIPLGYVNAGWNSALLQAAAAVLGPDRLVGLPAPCWLLIPDQS